MEDHVDLGTVRTIVRRFLLQNFRNVRAVSILAIGTEHLGDRWVYKVRGLASINMESIIPSLGSPIEVEVLVTQEGTVVTVQGQKWNNYQLASKRALPRKRDAKRK